MLYLTKALYLQKFLIILTIIAKTNMVTLMKNVIDNPSL